MQSIDKLTSFTADPQHLERFSQVNSKSKENLESIKKLSDEFESVFLEIVLKSMRETVDKSELTDGGNGEQIFQSMLDSEYSKSLAGQRMTGLAASIENHLLGLMGEAKLGESARKAEGSLVYKKVASEIVSAESPKK